MNTQHTPLNVGVIGVGAMGPRHCRIFSNLHLTLLAGVCDLNPIAGNRIAQQFHVPYYASVDDLLEHVDAVSVATPTPSHFDIAMRCIAKGVHVLIEKPIAATLEQAHQLAQTAAANNLVVQVGHIERFNPTYLELKNVVEDKRIAAINMRRLSAYQASNTDVDVVLDLMIHDLDLVLDMVNDTPAAIAAHGLSVFTNTIAHATAQLSFANGPLVTLTASRITEQKIRTIEVTTLDSFVEANLLNKSVTVHRRTVSEYLAQNQREVKYRQESIMECIHVPAIEPLFSELDHFANCIINGTRPQVSARDGYLALKMAFDIRDAINRDLPHLERPLQQKSMAVPVLV